jgi:hypothetical protein
MRPKKPQCDMMFVDRHNRLVLLGSLPDMDLRPQPHISRNCAFQGLDLSVNLQLVRIINQSRIMTE